MNFSTEVGQYLQSQLDYYYFLTRILMAPGKVNATMQRERERPPLLTRYLFANPGFAGNLQVVLNTYKVGYLNTLLLTAQ